jgi:hypothetical protein
LPRLHPIVRIDKISSRIAFFCPNEKKLMSKLHAVILFVSNILGTIFCGISAVLAYAMYYKWNETTTVSGEALPMTSYWPILAVIGIALVTITWIVGYKVLTQNAKTPSKNKQDKILSEKPDFLLTLLGAYVFAPEDEPCFTGIALEARIRNGSTSESIAVDWKLFVTIQGEQPKLAQLTNPPEQLTTKGQKTGVIVLHKSDFSLEKMASSKPLRVNEPPLEGRLLFYVDVPRDKVVDKDAVLQLMVDDVQGHTFSAKQRMGDWPQF